MKKINLCNAIVEKVSTRADRSIAVHLGLPELPAEEMVALFTSLQSDVVEVEITPTEGVLSPSQRLRNAMFVFYRENHGSKKGFEGWYIEEMARIKQTYLDKLN